MQELTQWSRRTVHLICGISVLFVSILYVHVFHHVFFAEHQGWSSPLLAAAIVSGTGIAGVFLLHRCVFAPHRRTPSKNGLLLEGESFSFAQSASK
jgi:hypothetical protein